MEQLELFPISMPKYSRGMSLQERFDSFHKTNPHILTMLLRYAFRIRDSGIKKCSINLLFERIRWDYSVTTDADEYKMNNSFRSRYARLMMEIIPSLKGFFDIRELKS